MAVTQQLVRVPDAQLAACRRSVEELDRLCSFELTPRADHLDLDWAPAPLLRACELASGSEYLVALRRSLDGDAEVNPAYRHYAGAIWEHPVSALEGPAVLHVAGTLRGLVPDTVLASLPIDGWEALGQSTGAMADPRGYVARHFAALLDFYEEAARRRLAVVMWWD
ncbi:hypothetical protein [Microtetraspora fusca]|uniref:hypothetical protein n=1 Tax=Microtetraspora fusca TaxID=1997 RepID=UPI0008299F59|nr:hypothetical protein [Microtetraspora fusca]